MPQRPPNIDDIYLAALERSTTAERSAYLDRACAGDVELRRRVERLLQAQRNVGSFLESPAPELVPTLTERPVSEAPGTVIGPYKLLEQIGEGGFGVVFMAEQTAPVKRKVALKVIKPGMDTRQVIARFEAERQALALMDHPNIAKVFDAGTTGEGQGSRDNGQVALDAQPLTLGPSCGRPYFVMELVRGVPITDYCDQHQLTPKQRLELFVTVCQAVQHAHQKGIIHRDIKPTNVLVTLHDDRPVVKVIDFGIAKATSGQLTDKTLFTGFAQLVGTPLYMSPEQASMVGHDVDTRSDIYSLGVLLYELLTGTTPFDRTRLQAAAFDEVRRIIREEEPSKPSTRLSELGRSGLPSWTAGNSAARQHTGPARQAGPTSLASVAALRKTEPRKLSQLVKGELDWIVMKALEKDRARRYETANSFAADVLRYLANEPVLACPQSAAYRFHKFVRRNKAPVAVTTGALLLLIAVAVGSGLAARRFQVLAGKNAGLAQANAGLLSTSRKNEEDAREQLFESLLNQARARRFSGQMGQRLDSLDALARAAEIGPDERLRDEAIAAMAVPDIRRGPDIGNFICLDGSYRRGAVVEGDGTISIYTVADDHLVQQVRGGSTTTQIGLSPDGELLAQIDGTEMLRIWRVADGEPFFPAPADLSRCFAFSPDSRRLAIGRSDGSILCFDLTTREEISRRQLPAAVQCVAFHPGNRKLAAIHREQFSVLSVCDTDTGAGVTDFEIGLVSEPVMAWHPGGELTAVSGSDARISIWEVATGRRHAVLTGHVQHVTQISFHPGGELLASSSWDGTVRLWQPATGRQLLQLPLAATTRFSDDGRWLGVALASPSSDSQLLEVVTCPEYRTIVSRRGDLVTYYDGDISPDGRLLALATTDGTRVWDLRGGRELAHLPSPSDHKAIFEPDGRGLLVSGFKGLHRWPMEPGGGAPGELQLGPPQEIPVPIKNRRIALTRDGRRLAIVGEPDGAAAILNLDDNSVQDPLLSHPAVSFVDISPDGRWVATGGWHTGTVRLWNAETGQMVHEWNAAQAYVCFTPDNRMLIICTGDAFAFWDLETLQVVRRLVRDVNLYPGYVAFSPDGTLIALEMAPGIVHLQELSTARTVARLEDPNGDRAGWMRFTPDGTSLVVVAHYARAIHVWDLRAIRTQLKTMRLDWEWPEFDPAPPATSDEHPLILRTVGSYAETALPRPDPGYWNCALGCSLIRGGHFRDAEAQFREAVYLDPENANAHRYLGNVCAERRDWKQAAASFNKALERQTGTDEFLPFSTAVARLLAGDVDGYSRLAESLQAMPPANRGFWGQVHVLRTCTIHPRGTTEPAALVALAKSTYDQEANNWSAQVLGMAHYRAGEFEAALERMEESQKLYQWYLFFPALAMAHHQLGRADVARQWLEQANASFRDLAPPAGDRLKTLKDDPYWQNWAYFEVMLQEASALIGGEM